ncbi:N-6-adenine-methyltransferase [Aureimonas endophytica]|uniref:N-6-adenine-methyltransferase n=1 Tax=Aureimonas endophytica TaxID=2027858 RepID=A0A916ZY32_9HYPH|nr:DNA N-6-adenine-methyltransferase [Aureimonas endophytica]GGE18488.1 N-6-adenine-methyltransferase [Aureimonas endophytica]
MAEHEPSIGASDDWYTPASIFDALGLTFDLDPCSPGAGHWVPARNVYTKADDGLHRPWTGLVFMNPPFGGREGHVPWLAKFLEHGNGIAIVRAYTSSDWFHRVVVPKAETILFPRGKTQFVPSPDLEAELQRKAAAQGKVWRNAPGHGVVLIGMGPVASEALRKSGLGFYVVARQPQMEAPRHD